MIRYAYVTGADRGLGFSLSKQLLEKDYYVFAGQYMPEWLELQKLQEQYPEALKLIPLDVSKDESVVAAAEAIKQETTKLDVLINNAGITDIRPDSILDPLSTDSILKQYNTNTVGPLRVTHSIIDLMMKGGEKRVVYISSEAASIAQNWRAENYGYCMSKTALNMQAAILQKHVQTYGIKVLAIHPGYVRSYMAGSFNEDGTVEAEDSARGILEQLESFIDVNGPMYIDYLGNILPY